MNYSFASFNLPCVVFIIILIQLIGTLDATNTNTPSNKHRRVTRSNQDESQNNITTSNNFQQYHPTKPSLNNVQNHAANNNSNVSQTPSTPSTSPTSFTSSASSNHPSSHHSQVASNLGSPNSAHNSSHKNGPFCHNNSPCHPQCHGRSFLNETRGFITDGSGNYPINVQCTWLIDSGLDNSTIRLRFNEFNTECNYDYLYIFDGNSIYSPLIAAFSGLLKPIPVNDNTNEQYSKKNTLISAPAPSSDTNGTSTPGSINNTNNEIIKIESIFYDEIVIKSGKAFIYFHSDTAQSMPGFNLTYTINSCPYDCSERGLCDLNTLECKCDYGFIGQGCQIGMCPNDCSSSKKLGSCDKSQKKCICVNGYSGSDCSKRADQGVWESLKNELDETEMKARSFHQAVVIDENMYIVGGKTASMTILNLENRWTTIIDRYNLITKRWESNRLRAKPGQDNIAELFCHTAINYNNKIYIYGGMLPNSTISNALLVFDTLTMTFDHNLSSIQKDKTKKLESEVSDEDDFAAPLAVVGHSATLVGQFMYIFFGYNPLYGYLDLVQKYSILDDSWTIIETRGSSVEGTIGHSSVYDEVTKIILVYGGHHAYKSNSLYSYDPIQNIWRLLQPAPYPRYYHRSLIINGQMLVFGGNSYNASSSQDTGDDCFDGHTLMYDLNCVNNNYYSNHYSASISSNRNNDLSICDNNCWQVIKDPSPGVLRRYGHSLVDYRSSLYIFGGFNGIILDTLHEYKIPYCPDYSNEKDCHRLKLALRCEWNRLKNSCDTTNSLQKQTFNQSKDSSLIQINSSSIQTTAAASLFNQDNQCPIKLAQSICETRQTCRDCLYTNFGCIWCGNGKCKADKCKSLASNIKAIVDPSLCSSDDTIGNNNTFLSGFSPHSFTYKETVMQTEKEIATEIECRRYVNCYLCHTKSYCSWQNDLSHQVCSFLPPSRPLPTPVTLQSSQPNTGSSSVQIPLITDMSPLLSNHSTSPISSTTPLPISVWKQIFENSPLLGNSSTTLSMLAMLSALSPSVSMTASPYQTCESPCFRRKSCKECVANKCVWCDTNNECIDSSAYFAYYPSGQCMHYVAHPAKCQGTLCSEIETCDQCQKNPKCGWLDDGTEHC